MNGTNKGKRLSRRKFIVRGGLGSIGLLALGSCVFINPLRRSAYGISESLVLPYSGKGTEANLWFEFTTENTLIFHSPKVEMGQGIFTGYAQIIADELDIHIDQIIVQAAATNTGILDRFTTGGSLSIAQLYKPLREMAAMMRQMILNEAANKLNIGKNALILRNGMIEYTGGALSYAKALEGVKDWKLPKKFDLKSNSEFKHIGKPIARVDLEDKIVGAPIFGTDAEMENMLHATILRPEHIGSKMREVNYSEAEKMPGVVRVVEGDGWLGIVAETFSEALAARRKVNVSWDIPKIWTEKDLRAYLKVGEGKRMVTQKEGSALEKEDEACISMEFSSPIGAHAQMEPNGAVAKVENGKAIIIMSTQSIGATQKSVAKALGFKTKDVNVVAKYLGGGFGRRLDTSHAVEVALMAREVGRPIKYSFTRKEEFQNDMFRPPTHHIVKGKMAPNGRLSHLEHHYASGDVAINSLLMPPAMSKMLGTDVGAMRGANVMYGNIKNRRAVQWHKTLPFATSFWRSLGLLANTFAIESFIDEMALNHQIDPIQLRLDSLAEDETQTRIKKVIQLAAEKSQYQNELQGNRAMGFAASIDVGAPCAHVAEVSLINNVLKVEKVTCVFDCGLAVNPDQVKAQCEGSIIMGISAAMHEKMGIKDGRLYPINYGTYDMALMKHSPKEIDVHLIQGVDDPLPVGEPPLGPIAAAIGNAIRRLTGKRLTDLPMKLA